MKSFIHNASSAFTFILCGLLLFVTGTGLFLFHNNTDEKVFSQISSELFLQEMTSSTLNMHYTIAHPETFGIHEYEAILPTYSAANRQRAAAYTESALRELENIDSANLAERDAYTYTLLTRSLENSLHLHSFPYYADPLSPASGAQSQLPILLAEYQFRNKRDIEDYLSLLEQSNTYFSSLLTFQKEKTAAGLLMPVSSRDKIIEQCNSIITIEELDLNTHFLQLTFSERLASLVARDIITPREADSYISQNNILLHTNLLPAYQTLSEGLLAMESSHLPLTGLASKPDGRDYYQYLFTSETGSYRSLEEVKALLIAKLKEEHQALHTILLENPELMEHFSSGKHTSLPYSDAESILSDLQNRMSTDFPRLDEGNYSLPSVSVKSVSASLEKHSAPAFYLTVPIDDTDTNVIYINQKNSPHGLDLYTTLAHEGYPGHLYQTVYNNRSFLQNSENNVRQLLWYGGYLEGWALHVEFLSYDYAAQIMEEQGRSTDALCIQLEKHNRSLQLCLFSILDIMIHYDNLTLTRVTEILGKFGISNPTAAEAVYNYIAEEPCNYPKYYIGYLEILALRETAGEAWGSAYSDYAFHTFYLDSGPSDFTSLTERLETYSSSMLSR